MEQLNGFFVGWKKRPDPCVHLHLLKNSDVIVLAQDVDSKAIIGFITAITDHVLSAYIPLLEVLPEYQNKGIGTQLLRLMLEELSTFYMIDLSCDSALQPFYKKFRMQEVKGMCLRNISAIPSN
ncbi:MAG: GNAT family N-acetyltransferase [Bacteroidota bacterium]